MISQSNNNYYPAYTISEYTNKNPVKTSTSSTNKLPNKMRGLAIEETCVDLNSKTLHLKSRNVGLSKYLTSEERCSYEVHPDDPNKTLYTANMEVTIHAPSSFSGLLEKQFLQNATSKAKLGLEVMKGKIESGRDMFPREEWERLRVGGGGYNVVSDTSSYCHCPPFLGVSLLQNWS